MRTIEYLIKRYSTAEYIILDDDTRYGWKCSLYDSEECVFKFILTIYINGCTVSRFISLGEKWMCEHTDLDTTIYLTDLAEKMLEKYKHLDPRKV